MNFCSGFVARALLAFAGLVVSISPTLAAAGEANPTGEAPRLFAEGFPALPPAWRIKSLPAGQSFVPVLYYDTFNKTPVETSDGPMAFSDLPWAKDAIVRVRVDQLKDPAVYKNLQDRSNAIMVFGEGAYGEPFMYPGKSDSEIDEYFKVVLGAKNAFGPRFLAWDYGEWSWGGVREGAPTRELTASLEALKMPAPKNLDGASAWFNKRYDLIFKRYQEAGIPVFSWNATSLNHYEARKGTAYTGNEIAYLNAAMDSTYIAFCRGAARQFDLSWGVYAAGYGGAFGHSSFWNSRSPADRHVDGAHGVRGPNTAVAMQEQQRTLYSVYMAGANFSIKENDGSQGMLSGYDPATIDRTDPRVIALQDAKTYAGPYAQLWSELWDTVVTKHDRGTPYTPVALLLDDNHGYVFKYSQTLALGAVPYRAAEEQIRGVINTVFPWESDQYAAGPFGDIFDVITTEAAEPIIGSYRTIVLVGHTKMDTRLTNTLRNYVERGGLLFMACEQLTPELWKLAGIADTGELGQDTSYLRASDFYVYDKQPSFEYHKVKLNGAQPLFVAGTYEERQWPVATINRVGSGHVIVGTPIWMRVAGDPTTMHGVFSEILGMISDELTPVQVDGGDVKVMYNRNDAGWVVTLMNNRGTTIAWPGFEPAVRSQDTTAVILRPRFAFTEATEWRTGKQWAGGEAGSELGLVLPPGEIRIVQLRMK